MEFKQLILLGPPGIGVKEQAQALSTHWHIPHVSMGQLIRDAIAKGSAVGLEAHPYVQAGELVPDNLVMKLLRRRFEQPDVMLQGWVLDGFPRTLDQAQSLNELLLKVGQPVAKVAELKAMTGLLIDRLSAQAGPEIPISAIRRRLTHHRQEITPLLEYYRQQQQLTTINASLSFAEITQALFELFQTETGAARFIRDESELNSLLANESLLVVDCMASWCGSCKLVTPLIDQLADAYKDRANVMKIDFDANQQVPKRFGLKGMPAVMFFKGGELVETLTGVKPYQAYSAAVTRFLK
ncbi:adenylate kinase [Leptolyngbya sp. Heron Island J]|uniref:nucleoside monophosphate kinase n=1 Tax=Leptolyngbya sp. Heron Island J TaxID=1385935 RepID=UPI0003B96032|nr:nucleoside monophosphate kinase [Leptolyngbya sp. Heron Island J]ESA33363.1 adenylate kinase [Leptolyngbya sp. Heron Island J]